MSNHVYIISQLLTPKPQAKKAKEATILEDYIKSISKSIAETKEQLPKSYKEKQAEVAAMKAEFDLQVKRASNALDKAMAESLESLGYIQDIVDISKAVLGNGDAELIEVCIAAVDALLNTNVKSKAVADALRATVENYYTSTAKGN